MAQSGDVYILKTDEEFPKRSIVLAENADKKLNAAAVLSANVWKFPHVAKTNGTPCGYKYKSQSGLKGCSVFIFVHNNSPVKIVIQSLLYSISYLLSNFHKVSYYYAKTC